MGRARGGSMFSRPPGVLMWDLPHVIERITLSTDVPVVCPFLTCFPGYLKFKTHVALHKQHLLHKP